MLSGKRRCVEPCEFCGSMESSYRPYLSQWIGYPCRLRPDQLVSTVSNLVEKYGLGKSVLLAAHELTKSPPSDLSWWKVGSQRERDMIAALERAQFRGPMELYVLSNPHRRSAAPMKLMKDMHVKRLAEVLLGAESVAPSAEAFHWRYAPRRLWRPQPQQRHKRPAGQENKDIILSPSKRARH